MKSIISIQKKLIAIFILSALTIIGVSYYYLNSMSTIEGNLNINKISQVNKLYSYNVYSDFYFRIAKYNDEGEKISEFSKLQPIKTSIGYDISKEKSKLSLKSSLNEDNKWVLSDTNGNMIKRDITMFNNFQKIFGKIVATQDSEYIQKSFNRTKETLKNLYGIQKDLDNKQAKDLYHEIKNLPIANMRVKYFQLDEIAKNLKGEIKIAPKDQWKPNIVEWNFGDNDRIYLQYLKKWKENDLDSFLKGMKNINKTIVTLVKINDNKLQKMYLIKDDNANKIRTLFMDENGYVYTLIFSASNPISFNKYISDYLKIAYGISFVDMKNFENWFTKEQIKMDKQLEAKTNLLICAQALEQYLGDDLLSYFDIPKNIQTIYTDKGGEYRCKEYPDKKIFTSQLNYDKRHHWIMKITSDQHDAFAKNSKNDIYDAVAKLDSGLFSNGKEKLKKICSNHSVECVRKLVENN